jgi:hypothetical protein
MRLRREGGGKMNVLEAAVYAMVLTAGAPKPFDCYAVQPDGVNCTNGLAATPQGKTDIAYSNGVTVRKNAKGEVSLSNGVTTFFDSGAWVTFKAPDGSTVVSARKVAPTRFKFSNGLHCETKSETPDRARCWRP